jgi:hypothetical protein
MVLTKTQQNKNIKCYVHGSVRHKSILFVQMSNEKQQYAFYILFYCKITLHVSGAKVANLATLE